MNPLEQLLVDCPTLFRGERAAAPAGAFLPTGYPELDALLPGGGWPLGSLIEVQMPTPGLAEIRLLLPALRRLQREGRHVIWADPPFLPYAPGLAQAGLDLARLLWIAPATPADLWWCAEKLLRHPACGAVMAWPARCQQTVLRRLQIAVEAGGGLGIVFLRQVAATSPAAVRLQLECQGEHLWVAVRRARGSWKQGRIHLGRADVPATA